MTTAHELLGNMEIREFLLTHQSAAPAIERAASFLSGKPDAMAALIKLLPALSSHVVEVFVSYNQADNSVARVVSEVLRMGSAQKLNIRFQGEFAENLDAMQWSRVIRDSIKQAHWFILLLPNPSYEWDWCFWETGLFEAQRTSADRLICVHHPDTQIPSPIAHYSTFAATKDGMEKFLRKVFLEEDPVVGLPPINQYIEERIPELAERIVEVFPPRKTRVLTTDWLTLIISDPGSIDGRTIPNEARVLGSSSTLHRLGLMSREWTWQNFVDNAIEPGDKRWIEEIAQALYDTKNGRLVRQPRATFRSLHDGKWYRFVLQEFVDLERACRFDLNLMEDLPDARGLRENVTIFGPPRQDESLPQVFMLMPFERELEPVFRDHVAKVVSELGLSAKRADDLFSNRSIAQDIWSAINSANVVVADCTNRNANVFYEIGLAHALGRNTVLIARSMKDIPFDLQHLRVIIYEFTPRGMQQFEEKLKAALEALEANRA